MGARRVVIHQENVGVCRGGDVVFFSSKLARLHIGAAGAVVPPCRPGSGDRRDAGQDPRRDIGAPPTA